MKREFLFGKLSNISDLPTLPAVMNRLAAAVSDPEADADRIAGIIRDDPSMMARILKVVNSAAYGASSQIISLQQAVSRLGLRGVQNIALSTSVFQTFAGKGSTSFDREEFWKHSVCVGIGANVLYERTRENLSQRHTRDLLHLAGLLHDIGKIVFEQFFHDDFVKALEIAARDAVPLFQAERSVFGADHCEVGAWLAAKWNLNEEITEAIRWHHEPENAAERHVELVRLCHTANYINCLEKIGDGGDNHAPVFMIGVWKRMGLKVRDIQDIVKAVIEGSEHSETLLAFMRG